MGGQEGGQAEGRSLLAPLLKASSIAKSVPITKTYVYWSSILAADDKMQA